MLSRSSPLATSNLEVSMNKIVRGTVFVSDKVTLRLPLVRPLTLTEQTNLKRQLEQYYYDTREYYGFATEGTDFDLMQSPRTERDTNVSALREVAEFLAGPGVTIQMVSIRQMGQYSPGS